MTEEEELQYTAQSCCNVRVSRVNIIQLFLDFRIPTRRGDDDDDDVATLC